MGFKLLSINKLMNQLDLYTFNQLHIHHTYKPEHKDFNGKNHLALQQGMCNYHVNHLKWSDIGQHVTLMPDGWFITGRDFSKTPASIKGWNKGAFAVEMLGNFDSGQDCLEGKQKRSMLKLIRYFINRFGKESIKFHNEGPSVTKTCPGTGIQKGVLIKEAMKKDMAFTDVDKDRWSTKYIQAAKDLGLMEGLADGSFNPHGTLTREQGAVLIIRLYEKLTGKQVV